MSAKVSCPVLRGGERGDPRTSPDLYGEELEQLKVLWKEYGAQDYAIPRDLVNFLLQLKGLLESEGDGCCQFTNLGKIPVGTLPKPRCSTKFKNPCCWTSWLRWSAL
jgi:hypothetical protein